MSDILARHRFRQDYQSLGTLMYEMACDGRRFDQGDFDTLQPMLKDLCDQADAFPDYARALSRHEGQELLRWYTGQWPKRDTDLDGTPGQDALAEAYAGMAIRIVASLNLDLSWASKNLLGIHRNFDAFFVDRLLNRDLGLYSYDLSLHDRYEDDSYSEAEQMGNSLASVFSGLSEAGHHDLLSELITGICELSRVAPESVSAQTRAQLFMSCFHEKRKQVSPALKAALGALLPTGDELDTKRLMEWQTDNFYNHMLNAAASGMREETEPLIQIALDNNYCPSAFKQLLNSIEQYTNIDLAGVMISFSHKIAANDSHRHYFRDILMSYYLVSENPVVPDQIEFEVNDSFLFGKMLRNEYSSYYDPQTQTLNMKNLKALLCEYLGQHAGQLNQLASDHEIGHIVKTLPYWHDHNFAVDLGL